MADFVDTRPRRPAAISDEEMARRRKLLRKADASNRIEGMFRSAANDDIFEAFVRGEIEVTDIVSMLDARRNSR